MRRLPGCRAGARSFGRRRQPVREAGTAGHRRRWARISSRVWGCGRTKGAPTRDRQRYEWRLHTGMQVQNGPHDRCWHNALPPNARRNRVPAGAAPWHVSGRACSPLPVQGRPGIARGRAPAVNVAPHGCIGSPPYGHRGYAPTAPDEPPVLGAAQTARLLRHEPDHQAAAVAPATHHALRVSSMAHPPWRNRLSTPMLQLRRGSACKDTRPAGRHAAHCTVALVEGTAARRTCAKQTAATGTPPDNRRTRGPSLSWRAHSHGAYCCGPGQGTPTPRSTPTPAGAPPRPQTAPMAARPTASERPL